MATTAHYDRNSNNRGVDEESDDENEILIESNGARSLHVAFYGTWQIMKLVTGRPYMTISLAAQQDDDKEGDEDEEKERKEPNGDKAPRSELIRSTSPSARKILSGKITTRVTGHQLKSPKDRQRLG